MVMGMRHEEHGGEERRMAVWAAKFADAERLVGLDSEGRRYYRLLTDLRLKLARELEVPAYRIFSDKQLLTLCEAKPRDAAALAAVRGMGPLVVRAYGAEILSIFTQVAGMPT